MAWMTRHASKLITHCGWQEENINPTIFSFGFLLFQVPKVQESLCCNFKKIKKPRSRCKHLYSLTEVLFAKFVAKALSAFTPCLYSTYKKTFQRSSKSLWPKRSPFLNVQTFEMLSTNYCTTVMEQEASFLLLPYRTVTYYRRQ